MSYTRRDILASYEVRDRLAQAAAYADARRRANIQMCEIVREHIDYSTIAF